MNTTITDKQWQNLTNLRNDKGKGGHIFLTPVEFDELYDEVSRLKSLVENYKQRDNDLRAEILRHATRNAKQEEELRAKPTPQEWLDLNQKIAIQEKQFTVMEETLNDKLRDSWSFETMLYVGQRVINEVYPETIFTGASGDLGPQYVAALRDALRKYVNKPIWKFKLSFMDWQKDGKSIYSTKDGAELSQGVFHGGSTFECIIDLDDEHRHELEGAIMKGFEPCWWMSLK